MDRTESIRIARIQHVAGRRHLLWVSTLQTDQLATQADVIRVDSLSRANRIQLHLALGGSSDPAPAISAPGVE